MTEPDRLNALSERITALTGRNLTRDELVTVAGRAFEHRIDLDDDGQLRALLGGLSSGGGVGLGGPPVTYGQPAVPSYPVAQPGYPQIYPQPGWPAMNPMMAPGYPLMAPPPRAPKAPTRHPAGFIVGGILIALAALAGLAALARLAFWQGGWTRAQPILWTLHLSYLTTALGLMLYAAALWGLLSEVAALHVLGIGAVGGMTLSVMSRAALGHSGRALSAPGGLALAYALVPAVTLLRFAGSAWPGFYFAGVLASGALWIAVFTLYLATLWPVFWQASPTPAEGASA